ncbi:LPS-assembly protein LptD [Candidatus Endowatersipora endosymbiont of Watersipora subatra]|uniref:LPS-assembly protein LptD n=1 Tax=Candidatus Endowatersipora endosymbiont of Watersipora subatra TaxID=3077946 RepID=UPI00312C6EB6
MTFTENAIAYRPLSLPFLWKNLVSLPLLASLTISFYAFSVSISLLSVYANTLFENSLQDRLFLTAGQLIYDKKSEIIIAKDNVHMKYDGYTMLANRLSYNQKTKRIYGLGNVEIVEPNGNHIYAEEIDITNDFGEGFAKGLRIKTPDNTWISSESAQQFTRQRIIFNHGVYTACESVEEDPIWQAKAEKIIIDRTNQIVTYEKAYLEFLGKPIAYLPWFRHAYSNSNLKTGFQIPEFGYNDKLGVWYRQPYFIASGTSYDLTLTTTASHRKGLFVDMKWQHQLENGFYSLKASGMRHRSEKTLDSSPDKTKKIGGLIASNGKLKFNLPLPLILGWTILATTDSNFPFTFKLDEYNDEKFVNKIYLTGSYERSFFNLSARKYKIQITDSLILNYQEKVLPLFDYNYVTSDNYAGGEINLNVSVTNLDRDYGIESSVLTPLHEAYKKRTRISSDLIWKKTVITSEGLMLTPSFSMKGDWTKFNTTNPTMLKSILVSDFMPMAALEVRYPLLLRTKTSRHIIEPVMQMLIRPDLAHQTQGLYPDKEEVQRLVFDTNRLFSYNNFYGFDPIERGLRTNIGVQYSGIIQNGITFDALFSQSFHLNGQNPYALERNLERFIVVSGLKTERSDYVASLEVNTSSRLDVIANARFDKDKFTPQRAETRINYRTQTLSFSTNYTYIQPMNHYESPLSNQYIGISTNYKFKKNWNLLSSALFNIHQNKIIEDYLRLSYNNNCFNFSLEFSEEKSYDSLNEIRRSVTFNISLRTIGDYQ